MCRYWVIDWELQSMWFTDDINEVNEGGSCRYGDKVDMIRAMQKALEEKELKALKEREDYE